MNPIVGASFRPVDHYHPPIYFDVEADSLDPTKIWCVISKETDEAPKVWSGPEFLDYLWDSKPDHVLVGHNIISYDLPALQKLWGFCLHNPVLDTLVMSRTMFADMGTWDTKVRPEWGQDPDTRKDIGSHSLRAWGRRLGLYKGEHSDFSKLSQEMIQYCVQDVLVTEALFHTLPKTRSVHWPSILAEHRMALLCERMKHTGVPFDLRAAERQALEWEDRMDELQFCCEMGFEPQVEQLKTKKKIHLFNPNSNKQVVPELRLRGWRPKEFTEKTGEPKLTRGDLEKLGKDHPEILWLYEYRLLRKWYGQLCKSQGAGIPLIQAVEDDGRIHGTFRHIGAVNHRLSHARPNLAQVTKIEELRGLFRAPKGYKMLGVDASGLEMRTLANRCWPYDNGALAQLALEGDFHTATQEAIGAPSRDIAKTWFYALIYGAGDRKLGETVGYSRQEAAAAGCRQRSAFAKKLPGMGGLMKYTKDRIQRLGNVDLVDGRELYIRSEHSALNTMLAGDGIIIIKYAMLEFLRRMEARWEWGHDFEIVLQVHDEWQTLVREEIADEAAQIALDSLLDQGRALGVKVPIEGEAKVGNTWHDTH